MTSKALVKKLLFSSMFTIITGCAVDRVSTVVGENSYPGYADNIVNPAIRNAISALMIGDPEYANNLLNGVLSDTPRDPLANLLNGMAYQARATGEGPYWDMAKVGYQLARKFDPYLWQASYLLGMMKLKERSFAAAAVAFSEAALANPSSAVPLYALAAASYSQGNISIAYRAVQTAASLDEDKPTLPEQQIIVLCTAAVGEFAVASSQIAAMRAGGAPNFQTERLEQKLRTWQDFYANKSKQPLLNTADQSNTIGGTALENAPVQPRMANIEAIILRTATADSQNRGINLLEGLSTQFEGVLINSSRNRNDGVTTNYNRGDDFKTNETTTDPNTFEQNTSYNNTFAQNIVNQNTFTNSVQLSVPAVKYSLNIVNSADSYSRMVGNPSVLALDGKESKFFIGSELTVFLPGYSSSAATKDFGLSIQVTPTFLSDDTVQLQVDSGLSTLNFSKPPGVSLDALSLEKVTNTTSAIMHFGETLAVSTGTIYQESSKQSGVPILNKTPIIDNLFSSRGTNTSKGTLLILLTLKPYQERNTPTNNASGVLATNAAITKMQQYLAPVVPQVQTQLDAIKNIDVLRITSQTNIALANPVYTGEASDASQQWRQRFFNELLVVK